MPRFRGFSLVSITLLAMFLLVLGRYPQMGRPQGLILSNRGMIGDLTTRARCRTLLMMRRVSQGAWVKA